LGVEETNYMQAEWFHPQRTQHWVLYIKLILEAIFFQISKILFSIPRRQTKRKLFCLSQREVMEDSLKAPLLGVPLQLYKVPEKHPNIFGVQRSQVENH
jgi:hypothetical protein